MQARPGCTTVTFGRVSSLYGPPCRAGERVNITVRWIRNHVPRCPLAAGVLLCCLPTCVKGFTRFHQRGFSFGRGFLLSLVLLFFHGVGGCSGEKLRTDFACSNDGQAAHLYNDASVSKIILQRGVSSGLFCLFQMVLVGMAFTVSRSLELGAQWGSRRSCLSLLSTLWG